MSLVINFFGGPGCGKSTTSAGLFYLFKSMGDSAELAREYAKDVVWEGRLHLLENQIYLFAKQLKRLKDLDGKVDYIITDSPLLLGLVYAKDHSAAFHELILEEFNSFNNLNIFLPRDKPYYKLGRVQEEAEAVQIDSDIKHILDTRLWPGAYLVIPKEWGIEDLRTHAKIEYSIRKAGA